MRVMLDFEDCCVEWVDIAELDNLEDALDTYVAEYLTALDNPTAGFRCARKIQEPIKRDSQLRGVDRTMRIATMAQDFYFTTFETLTKELGYPGEGAEQVADAIEKTFLQAIRVLDNRPE